jgi:YD repeat-containing protein
MTFKSKIRIWRKLTVEHGGQTFVGSYTYTAADQTVEIRSLKGERKATQLGGSTPEALAKFMLIELASEGKA